MTNKCFTHVHFYHGLFLGINLKTAFLFNKTLDIEL